MDMLMERRAITVRGIVQGVGFRPFVHGLALRMGLRGFVKNQSGRVVIEVEGEPAALDRFLANLESSPPPLSRIESVSWQAQPVQNDAKFRIEESDADSESLIYISPDVATCDACLAELFDPSDRRYRYPFLNCTHCGPRLTIIRGAPYDRERTTMASFAMCPACRAEYDDPGDRRFHAQPTACADCGPRLSLQNGKGERIEANDPLAFFVAALRRGKIGALKGLGGFHLVCDASDDAAVRELRQRKQRDERPFAVMVADLETAERFCEIDADERAVLISPRRPIVLLRKRRASTEFPQSASTSGSAKISDAVAPGNPHLGIMLPYTPLHQLLMRAVAGAPLVMTSGNRSDEPIAYLNDEAIDRLGSIADVFLMHDRPIHVRCDDSVTRIVDGSESPVRRSRGYAPQPVRLPLACPCPILAVGGQLKGVFALGRERQAFLSHHMGDLDHWDAYRAFVRDIGLYQQLFAVEPQVIVHDLHPDYASTNYARERAAGEGLRRLPVQHHHAHMASCMAEHGLDEPVIGVSFDGTGFGTDGAIWGGEFLVGGYREFRRAAHLRYVRMPGGDKAIHEPWRMAVAHLHDAGCSWADFDARVTPAARRTMETMIERRFNAPRTSSAGRLFDAVASIAGVRDRVSFEGQAAMQLEQLATESESGAEPEAEPAAEPDLPYPFEIEKADEPSNGQSPQLSVPVGWNPAGETDIIDTRPLIRAVLGDVQRGVETRRVARRFHSTVVEIICQVCGKIRDETQLQAVVLSGGVFMNGLVAHEAAQRLRLAGFRVYRHRLVPPNDGGLSLGQLAIAAATVSTHENNPAAFGGRASLQSSETPRGTNECASPSPAGSLKLTKSTTS
jgi:hydrogenase maturation protein HypF